MKTSRRKLLKVLTAGGGAVTVTKLPTKWTAPVVESVILPAHAQTTTDEVDDSLPSVDDSLPFMRFTGNLCSDGPDDQYYRITFQNDPAQSGDAIFIQSFGNVYPPTLPGVTDQVVAYARQSLDNFGVIFITNWAAQRFCDGAVPVESSPYGLPSGAWLHFTTQFPPTTSSAAEIVITLTEVT